MPRTERSLERMPFDPEALDELLARARGLAAEGDGWINVIPEVATDDPPSSLGFFTLFGGGGPGITMGTWIPPGRDRRGTTSARLGLAHRTGSRAVPYLATRGHALPTGWFVEQDHPRRGLVLLLPPGTDDRIALEWIVRAVTLLSPPPGRGAWHADIYARVGE